MEQFSFTLDYSGETRRVSKYWQFCIGSGHAALAHRTDYIEQLKNVHDELRIERVRFHGIFNDDMNVCQRLCDHLPLASRNRTKLYGFYQVAKIYDNLLKIGVKPFVELGFMPSALASDKKTVFSYKGNVTMPKNMSEWQDFIRAFARFLIDRYGEEIAPLVIKARNGSQRTYVTDDKVIDKPIPPLPEAKLTDNEICISKEDSEPVTYRIDTNGNVKMKFTLPAMSYRWYVLRPTEKGDAAE